MIRWASILLAAAGFALAVAAVTPTFPTPPDIPPERQPSVNPFPRGVAALGVVEPASRTIEIAPPAPGLVVEVLAEVGERVKAGDVLLRLDDREPRAKLVRAEAGTGVKRAQLDRWKSLPRAEDLPPLEAAVRAAEASVAAAAAEVANRRDDVTRLTDAVRSGARGERDAAAARFLLEQSLALEASAQGRLEQAKADLAKARAGGWAPDRDILSAELAQQEAEITAIRIELDRLVVRAPRDATVLRRDVEPGEYAGVGDGALMVLGDLSALHVRAQVDEEDIALVRTSAKAMGRTRGAVVKDIPLSIIRIEPFARSKTQLTGSNTERVDTRVVDVVLAVDPASAPLLLTGQAIDVYIDSTR
jgi:multidrug efflux pump subunit AcrA (membrane-fusion protein)